MNTYFTNRDLAKVGKGTHWMAQMAYDGAVGFQQEGRLRQEQVIVHIGRIYPVRDWRLFSSKSIDGSHVGAVIAKLAL
jgi:hypothetical protein